MNKGFVALSITGELHYHGVMELFETIRCPFCGQSFEIGVDTSVPQQRFTTDCEICCRPFDVIAECEAGEVLSIEVANS